MKSERGMSLVELLVSVSIMGIALTSFLQIFSSGNAASGYITDVSEMSENVDAGMLDFPQVRGIVSQSRMASSVVEVSAAILKIMVSDTVYLFYQSGTNLARKNMSLGTEETIAENIKGVSFKYYGTSGGIFQAQTDTQLINLVCVELEVESADHPTRSLKISAPVRLRNKS